MLNWRSRLILAATTVKPLDAKESGLTPAAVLVAISRGAQPHLFLTTRPHTMRHHPGQISFPGGKVDPSDNSLLETALREAKEEIGLPSQWCKPVCQLPAHNTITGFSITPIIASVPHNFRPKVDAREVSDCFTVPLGYLLDRSNYHTHRVMRNGQAITVYFLPYQGRLIWGATAAILYHIAQIIKKPEIY